jgi:sigma-B regulation protein RsbU (phosphoserine phosphatase)
MSAEDNNNMMQTEINSDACNRVLVVEDSVSERFRLVALLKKLGFEVLQAADGREALSILDSNPVDIILSDWNMPVMTGLDLCRVVRTEYPGHLYFILITGRETTEDLVEGMEVGADDFIRKPFNGEELRVRLIAGQRIVRMQGKLEMKNRMLEQFIELEKRFNEQTREELAMASEMLGQMLPENSDFTDNIHVAVFFRPALGIGGDFYNFFKLDERYIGFYVLDVAGHGITSALFSFSLARTFSPLPKRSSVLYYGERIRTPAEVVGEVNRRFLSQDTGGKYFTMVYGVLDSVTGRGQLCQAGHPYPVMIAQDGSREKLGDGGFPIGILEDAEFDDIDFELKPGSRLVLYTDGITELDETTTAHEGLEQLLDIMLEKNHAELPQMVDHVGKRLAQLSPDESQSDDMALVVIENR